MCNRRNKAIRNPFVPTSTQLETKRVEYSEEKLDFIINQYIKYRMGDELNEE